jgi:hypothetical protein
VEEKMKENEGKLGEISNEPSVTDIVLNTLIPGGCTNFAKGMDQIGHFNNGSVRRKIFYGSMMGLDLIKLDVWYDAISKYLM